MRPAKRRRTGLPAINILEQKQQTLSTVLCESSLLGNRENRKRNRAGEMKEKPKVSEKKLKGMESIKAQICLQSGRRISMLVGRHDTIQEVQAKLYELFSVQSQSVMYDGHLVNKYSSCEDIGLCNGGTLFLHHFPGDSNTEKKP
uniref:Ubiquitin-like domain-containing protein n=1 Tax=Lotharella oceanica TaxID=641309 RepID=A0A7S2TMG3_9EUKA|mmetsp:Transcript_21014/g.39437  ORF Transcript_21014/g.39437 Transcript_21014/m.39437 type:complete len:145 (+) Transcript_21014:100-534(+)